MTNYIPATVALSVPSTDLPSCRFASPEDSWANDAWDVLREIAESGKTARETCGSELVFSAIGRGTCTIP